MQNKTVMLICIIVLIGTGTSGLLAGHAYPHQSIRDGIAILLSLFAAKRLWNESRKPVA